MPNERVALLCPVAESVPPVVFQLAVALTSQAARNGIEVSYVGVTERTLIDSARNILAKNFLATDTEWAFWMDADMVLPPPTLTQLMRTARSLDAKFVTGVYYQRVGEHLPILWVKEAQGMDGKVHVVHERPDKPMESAEYRHIRCGPQPGETKPIRADVCGFGCVLTHRSLFEKTPYPYFKMIADVCSEDFYFCVNAKKAGFQLWADPSLKIGHVGQSRIITSDDFNHNGHDPIPVKSDVVGHSKEEAKCLQT